MTVVDRTSDLIMRACIIYYCEQYSVVRILKRKVLLNSHIHSDYMATYSTSRSAFNLLLFFFSLSVSFRFADTQYILVLCPCDNAHRERELKYVDCFERSNTYVSLLRNENERIKCTKSNVSE